jgi:hypothetical protein
MVLRVDLAAAQNFPPYNWGSSDTKNGMGESSILSLHVRGSTLVLFFSLLFTITWLYYWL